MGDKIIEWDAETKEEAQDLLNQGLEKEGKVEILTCYQPLDFEGDKDIDKILIKHDSGDQKDLKVAIPPFIIATIIALLIVWFSEKKIPKVPLLSGVLITFFGGLTIYFNNPVFIYIKPTIINILFGLALVFGKYFTN